MTLPLSHWAGLYTAYKSDSLCLDIETEGVHGPITIVGLYRPRDGLIECTQLVRGIDLTQESLRNALKNCRLLITFNGIKHDIARMYAKDFTEKELDELAKFYQTPLGRKAARLLPQYAAKGAEIGQRKVMENMSELQKMIAEEEERLGKKAAGE